MRTARKILGYQLRDIARNRWVLGYTGLLLLLTEALFQLGGDAGRVVLSLLNLVLILVPLVALVFGTLYLYSAREFIELLLAQPVGRGAMFAGLWAGLALPLSGALVAGLVVFPLVAFIPATPVALHVTSWPLLVAVVLLASLTAGALGLALGTIVRPQQIGLMFAVVVVPITFLGCVYYPWATLRPLRWLQVAVLVNPLVYMSEGLRAALTPELPHMPPWAFLGALGFATLALGAVGVRAFVRRTIS